MGAAIIGLYLQYILKTSLNPNKKYLVNVDKLLKDSKSSFHIPKKKKQKQSKYTTYSIYIPTYIHICIYTYI